MPAEFGEELVDGIVRHAAPLFQDRSAGLVRRQLAEVQVGAEIRHVLAVRAIATFGVIVKTALDKPFERALRAGLAGLPLARTAVEP